MSAWIPALERKLYAIERVLCSASLLVMLLAATGSVIIRFFGLPLPNVAELAVVAMSPLAFVGTALCSRMRMHLSVDVLSQMDSRLVKAVADFAVAGLMLVFSVTYAWLGWSLLDDTVRTGEQMLDIGTPLFIPAGFFFMGMVMTAIHSLLDLGRALGLNPEPVLTPENAS